MDGILPLYKLKGMTSFDCVGKLRTLTRQRKIGHTGTLDPYATGVLPVCIGQATKVVPYMAEDEKTYEAEVTLGAATTTEDVEGEIIDQKNVTVPPSPHDVSQALQKWTGTFKQIPPMYSAVKVNGRRLYEYAREGTEVERPQRTVTIHELQLLEDSVKFDEGRLSFSVHLRCSKGTYVRTLAVDIGQSLGFPAYMSALVRTVSGRFALEDCLTFADVEHHVQENTLESKLIPFEQGLASLKKLTVHDELGAKVQNGAVLPLPVSMEETRFTVFNDSGKLLAIYQPHPSKPGLMKPERVFTV